MPITNPFSYLILWRLRTIIHNWWSRNQTGSGSRPPRDLLWWWDSRPSLPVCQAFLPFIIISVLFLLCAWYFDQTGLDPGPWTPDPEPWTLNTALCFLLEPLNQIVSWPAGLSFPTSCQNSPCSSRPSWQSLPEFPKRVVIFFSTLTIIFQCLC